jgi:hypothetical protein
MTRVETDRQGIPDNGNGQGNFVINHQSPLNQSTNKTFTNQQTRHTHTHQDIHTHIDQINPQDCLLPCMPWKMPCHGRTMERRPAPAGRIPLEGVLICLGFFFFGLRGAQGEPLNVTSQFCIDSNLQEGQKGPFQWSGDHKRKTHPGSIPGDPEAAMTSGWRPHPTRVLVQVETMDGNKKSPRAEVAVVRNSGDAVPKSVSMQ